MKHKQMKGLSITIGDLMWDDLFLHEKKIMWPKISSELEKNIREKYLNNELVNITLKFNLRSSLVYKTHSD